MMINELEAQLKDLQKRVMKLEMEREASKPVDLGDLTSDWNNFVIRRDPKNWVDNGGPSYEGQRLSEASPEYLDALAGMLEWKAKKEAEEGKTYPSKKTGELLPVSPLTRKDAARARAWAERLRKAGPRTESAHERAKRNGYQPDDDDGGLPF